MSALLEELVAAAPEAAGEDPIALLRTRAARALQGLRLPTLKDEAWRFTPLTALTERSYRAAPRAHGVLLPQLSRFLLPEADDHRLTFVDGHFAPELSSVASPCPGITVAPLSALGDDDLGPHLGHYAGVDDDVFAALATRWLGDGALVRVPDGMACEKPIQLLFVSTGREPVLEPPHPPTQHGEAEIPRCSFVAPRVLIEAGRESRVTVVQEYVALEEGAYFVDAVTEVAVGDGARVRHVRVQSESRNATHIERLAASVGRDAGYALQSITLGGRLSRVDISVVGRETGMDASLDGLALLAGDQEADTHSAVVHAKPHGRSRQLHKMVLDDRAHAVFGGKIVVHPLAQQTDSSQGGRGLLLSDKARIDTKPELAIEADDVKCAHGVAIGQIDDDQLFYLKSRGIDEPAARDLLTYAFAAEVIDHVPLASLRKQLKAVVLGRTDRLRREAATP